LLVPLFYGREELRLLFASIKDAKRDTVEWSPEKIGINYANEVECSCCLSLDKKEKN
jgi:hypothetical protein